MISWHMLEQAKLLEFGVFELDDCCPLPEEPSTTTIGSGACRLQSASSSMNFVRSYAFWRSQAQP